MTTPFAPGQKRGKHVNSATEAQNLFNLFVSSFLINVTLYTWNIETTRPACCYSELITIDWKFLVLFSLLLLIA